MKCTRIFIILCSLIFIVQIPLYSQSNALYWFNKGRETSAKIEKIKYYKKAIELKPNFIEAHFNLGHIYKNIGRLQEAEESYKNALISNPGKLNNKLKQLIFYELGIIYGKLGRYEEAEKYLSKALNLIQDNSQKATILYNLGQVNVLMNRFKKAISFFEKGMEVYPVNKESFETAITQTKDQKRIFNYYLEGLDLLNQKKNEEAIAVFEKIMNINPNYRDTIKLLEEAKTTRKNEKNNLELKKLYNKGLVHIKNSDWQSAIKVFEQVLAKSPNYEMAQENLNLAQQKYESSLKNKSLNRYYNDGSVALEKGDYINAIIAYERVKKIDPTYKDINLTIQKVQEKLEKQNDQKTKEKFYNQGLSAYEKEDWVEALDAFTKVYALDPNYQNVQDMIKQTKEKVDELAEQETIDIYYQEGLALMRQGDWLNALINFEKVKMIAPDYKEINTLISQCNHKFDNTQKDIIEPAHFPVSNKTNPLLIAGIVITAIFIPFWGIILLFPTARARLYLLQKKYDKARQVYENILNYNPEKVKIYISLANIYINENRKDEVAVKVFKKVIESNLNMDLKNQLAPIVNKYYLERGEINNNSLNENSLKDDLKK